MRAGGTARDSSGRRGWSRMRHWRGEAKTLENKDLREQQTARKAETGEAKEAPAPGPVWRDELEQEEEQSPGSFRPLRRAEDASARGAGLNRTESRNSQPSTKFGPSRSQPSTTFAPSRYFSNFERESDPKDNAATKQEWGKAINKMEL